MTSACLIGCGVLTGVGSVLNRAKVQAGDTAAVFGVGGVGLNVIQGLRLAGASRIVAVDTLASKEDLARQFGATHFVDASSTDAVAAIRELVPHGPDRVAGALGWTGGVNWAVRLRGPSRRAAQCPRRARLGRLNRWPSVSRPRAPRWRSTSTPWPTWTAACSAAATGRRARTTTSP